MSGLPTDRDFTLTGVTGVPSALANKLQDQIILMKFPVTDFPSPAGDWRSLAAANAALGDGQWAFTGVQSLEADVRQIPGTLISAIKFAYDRGGGGGAVNFRLKKRNLVTGAAVVIVSSAQDLASGAGWRTITLAPAYTIETNFTVWLEHDGQAGSVFGGAIITASRL